MNGAQKLPASVASNALASSDEAAALQGSRPKRTRPPTPAPARRENGRAEPIAFPAAGQEPMPLPPSPCPPQPGSQTRNNQATHRLPPPAARPGAYGGRRVFIEGPQLPAAQHGDLSDPEMMGAEVVEHFATITDHLYGKLGIEREDNGFWAPDAIEIAGCFNALRANGIPLPELKIDWHDGDSWSAKRTRYTQALQHNQVLLRPQSRPNKTSAMVYAALLQTPEERAYAGALWHWVARGWGGASSETYAKSLAELRTVFDCDVTGSWALLSPSAFLDTFLQLDSALPVGTMMERIPEEERRSIKGALLAPNQAQRIEAALARFNALRAPHLPAISREDIEALMGDSDEIAALGAQGVLEHLLSGFHLEHLRTMRAQRLGEIVQALSHPSIHT